MFSDEELIIIQYAVKRDLTDLIMPDSDRRMYKRIVKKISSQLIYKQKEIKWKKNIKYPRDEWELQKVRIKKIVGHCDAAEPEQYVNTILTMLEERIHSIEKKLKEKI